VTDARGDLDRTFKEGLFSTITSAATPWLEVTEIRGDLGWVLAGCITDSCATAAAFAPAVIEGTTTRGLSVGG